MTMKQQNASTYTTSLDLKKGRVELRHGGGGKAMTQLVEQLFVRAFANPGLAAMNDYASLNLPPGRVVMATDSHVISPLFFPGGDIGSLAVHGTINDVAMSGAVPYYLSAGFILEEGFALADLSRIVDSMAEAASAAGVVIVTGDTKVVERGKADGCFINTTGIGVVAEDICLGAERVRPGDKILLSGTLGDHGIAVMSQRQNLAFETSLQSDSQALHGLVATMLAQVESVNCLRDPTRGGLSATLNEIAQQVGVGMVIDEAQLPVRPEVNAACELLGLDPLLVANEGKLVAFCKAEDADALLAAMKAHPQGREAAIIGEVVEDPLKFVQLNTRYGGRRLLDWVSGDQLPRIC